jgi:hypothetical protein
MMSMPRGVSPYMLLLGSTTSRRRLGAGLEVSVQSRSCAIGDRQCAPVPSPRGTNYESSFLARSFAAVPDASSGQVFGSEAETTFVRLHRLASDRLAPEDLAKAVTLIQQLFGDTASNGNQMTADLLR